MRSRQPGTTRWPHLSHNSSGIFIVPDLDPLIPRLDVDESERGHRPVTLISDPWTTAITRFALSRQHLSAITVFRVV
ncbi:hypothetical protein U6J60_08205 [Cutibacterium acnes]|uniref:hypothetical protein n=1 Tax=Cutibacterium acnes TaxID=1747 RepID=UPI00210BD873|nr:hypothetical protein [Cutibacterium acnes]MCA3772648.1 hypothetical protein [Cutibacterium sp.]MCQ8209052.1 hypothetical protein [Cutibacterium acnes subsp. acnes]